MMWFARSFKAASVLNHTRRLQGLTKHDLVAMRTSWREVRNTARVGGIEFLQYDFLTGSFKTRATACIEALIRPNSMPIGPGLETSTRSSIVSLN